MSGGRQPSSRSANARVDRRSFAAGPPKGPLAVLVCCLVVSIMPQIAGAEDSDGGKKVVDEVCAACHRTGVNGAPKIGEPQAWAKFTPQGLTNLTEVALTGIRQMPPHGGNPDVTDIEIELAITYMVNQSGGSWIEPINKSAPVAQRNGEQVVRMNCAKCHETGVGGAPKFGDRAAWIPRLKQGFDAVVRSAIKGHGPMPSRGGVTDITDTELRTAIVFMIEGPGREAPSR